MNFDKILMIPYLSKELGLIGYAELPYKLKKNKKRVKIKKGSKIEQDFSSDEENHKEPDMKITFDNKLMINSLLTVCFDLVKEVKKFHEFSYKDEEIQQLVFDNQKLKKQLEASNRSIKECNNLLSVEKEKCRQLNAKVEKLEKDLKALNFEKRKYMADNHISMDLLSHELKKKDTDLQEVHKVLWKKFNLVDNNYLPKNFEIMKSDSPDFKRLWSDVKYSGNAKKEDVLKSAICKFQENNEIMFEDNLLLKSVLLATLEEINELINLIKSKMKMKLKNISKDEIFKIFRDVRETNVDQYRNYLHHHFRFLEIIFRILDEDKFSIGDDIFVCWSDALKKLENSLKSEMERKRSNEICDIDLNDLTLE